MYGYIYVTDKFMYLFTENERRLTKMTTGKKPLRGAFSYLNEIPVEVLEILDTEDTFSKDYWYEIIKAGCKNRIDYTREFNQVGYATTVMKNRRMAEYKDYKKTARFCDASDEASLAKGCVSYDVIKPEIECYREVDTQDEISSVLEEFKSIQNYLYEEENLDIRKVIKSALEGIPEAVARLRGLCNKYDDFAESLQVLLSEDAIYAVLE